MDGRTEVAWFHLRRGRVWSADVPWSMDETGTVTVDGLGPVGRAQSTRDGWEINGLIYRTAAGAAGDAVRRAVAPGCRFVMFAAGLLH